jgi:hypothetical protein
MIARDLPTLHTPRPLCTLYDHPSARFMLIYQDRKKRESVQCRTLEAGETALPAHRAPPCPPAGPRRQFESAGAPGIIVVVDGMRGTGAGSPDGISGAIFADVPESLRPFIKGGRIAAIPARRAPRLLLLNQVAQAFEPGRRYAEAVVNEVLKALHDDHAALRRYLVDEDLMSRTPDGIYWRSGGTVTFRE